MQKQSLILFQSHVCDASLPKLHDAIVKYYELFEYSVVAFREPGYKNGFYYQFQFQNLNDFAVFMNICGRWFDLPYPF